MLKRAVVYPFLFVIYVILNPLANNLGQVDPNQAWRPLILLLVAATLGYFFLYAIFKDWDYAGYLLFLGLVFFFLFAHLSRIAQEWLPINEKALGSLILLGWGLILMILGLRRLWHRFDSQRWMTPFLNITLILALMVPAYTVSGKVLDNLGSPGYETTTSSSHLNMDGLTLDCTNRPDIYYIILDGYGREDVLEGLYGIDNTPFIDYLTGKGFYVANQSHTNYIQTIYSIPSALSFDYTGPPPKGVEGVSYFSKLMAENRIMRLLKGCGYQVVAIESGFFYTDHLDVDLYLVHDNGLNEFENLLLAETPLDVLGAELNVEVSKFSYEAHRQRVLFSLRKLGDLPRMPGPKFVFTHILSPHPPFVIDANGGPIEPTWDYSLGDGENYAGNWDTYRQGYAGQVHYINRLLEKTIENILSRSSTPPVIIIQADHGPGGFLQWKSPTRTCLWERASIFNAYYLPAEGAEALYPSISPVNTFRVILNAYFAGDLELVQDRTYFTSHRLERQVIDITEERDSKENCGGKSHTLR